MDNSDYVYCIMSTNGDEFGWSAATVANATNDKTLEEQDAYWISKHPAYSQDYIDKAKKYHAKEIKLVRTKGRFKGAEETILARY